MTRHDPMSAATVRRLPAVVGAVAIGMLSLTACGTDSSSAQSTVTVTQSASASAAASTSATTEARSPQIGTGAPVSTVNIEEFAGYGSGGKGYYFQSSSGNINCAIKLADNAVPPGCMAEVSVRSANGATCPGNENGWYLSVIENGSAASRCEVGETPHWANDNGDNGLPAGGRVLNPGESVSADGVTCTSTAAAITCTVNGTGRGFRMGERVNETF